MPKHILLVEDDPFLVEIYQKKLVERGFLVTVVSDGEEVLEKAAKVKPDLIILDIVLPRLDGWEVLKKIKDQASDNKNLKVIILSNLGQKFEIKKGLELGADDYLVKAHFNPSEVVKKVEQLLKPPI